MSYQLDDHQRAEFNDLVGLVKGTISVSPLWQPGSYYDRYSLIYSYLVDAQTDATTGSLKSGVDAATVTWLRGAVDVNGGASNVFANFIRSYTSTQFELRIGSDLSSALLQQTSNAIANSVVGNIQSGEYAIPSLRQIGERDAGATVSALYGDPADISGWAGAPLFVILGDDSFYRGSILDAKNGTYDFLAMVESSLAATSTSVTSFYGLLEGLNGVISAIGSSGSGFVSTARTVVDLARDTNTYFREHYLQSYGFSFAMTPGVELGKNAATDDLYGSSDFNLIHAGGGNDTVHGSLDSDILDGGAGTDLLDYSDVSDNLQVFVESTLSNEVGLLIYKPSGAIDRAAGFESLLLGSGADRIRLGERFAPGEITIDGGGQPSGQKDVLDFSHLPGVTTTTDPNDGTFVLQQGETTLKFRGFEVVKGSDYNDQFFLNDDDHVIMAGGGFNTIVTGAGNDLIEKAAGVDQFDLVTTGAGNDRLILGDGGATIVFDESKSDRLYIREMSGGVATGTLIPILGGIAGYTPGQGPTGSTFASDPDFDARLITSLQTENGTEFISSSFQHEMEVHFLRSGSALVVQVAYEGGMYGASLQNFTEGDFGITFVEGIDIFTVDGVQQWYDQAYAEMQTQLDAIFSASHFSDAPLPSSYDLNGALAEPVDVDGASGDDGFAGDPTPQAFDGESGYNEVSYASSTSGVGIDRSAPASSWGDASFDTYANIQGFSLSSYDDFFSGLSDAESVHGGAGDDELLGGAGDDTINGGAGADYIDGGDGLDVASFANSTQSVVIDLNNATANSGDALGDVFDNIEQYTLSDHADQFDGSGASEIVLGRAGSDIIHGGAGLDTIDGGAGDDFLFGDEGADSFVFTSVGFGTDTIYDFQDGTDSLTVSTSVFADASDALSHATQIGSDVVISAGDDGLILKDFMLANLSGGDFIFV